MCSTKQISNTQIHITCEIHHKYNEIVCQHIWDIQKELFLYSLFPHLEIVARYKAKQQFFQDKVCQGKRKTIYTGNCIFIY